MGRPRVHGGASVPKTEEPGEEEAGPAALTPDKPQSGAPGAAAAFPSAQELPLQQTLPDMIRERIKAAGFTETELLSLMKPLRLAPKHAQKLEDCEAHHLARVIQDWENCALRLEQARAEKAERRAQEEADAQLKKFAARAKKISGVAPERVVREGDKAEEILKIIDEDEDIFVLVLAAMVLAVSFATEGAMAGTREIIEVLHFVGAADSFISRQFQRHFFHLGLRGGAIGGLLAILAFAVSQSLAAWLRATPGGDQIEAMFGDFSLEWNVWAAIALLAAGIAIVTGLVSRVIVLRHLRSLN